MAGERTFKVRIVGNSTDAQQAIRAVARQSDHLRTRTVAMGSFIGGVATKAFFTLAHGALMGAEALVNFSTESIAAAEESQAVDAKLGNATRQMGLFGKQTADVVTRLQEYASKLQYQIGIDDEVIKQTQTKLMTFKDLARTADETGGMFDRATEAAFNLAAQGFGSAATNAAQLGKALQDPIKGLTSLTRAGVTFTATEKDKIKALVESNRLGEAQAIVMAAIEKQSKGAAAKGATWSQKLAIAWGELKESVGKALLPAFKEIVKWLVEKVIPAFQTWWSKHGQDVMDGMQRLAKWFISDFIPAVRDVWKWIKENLIPIFKEYAEYLKNDIWPLLQDVGKLISAFFGLFDTGDKKVGSSVKALDIFKLILGFVRTHVEDVRVVVNLLTRAFEFFGDVIRTAQRKAVGFLLFAKEVINFFRTLKDRILGALSTIKNWLVSSGKKLIQGLKEGITTVWQTVNQWFGGLPGKVVRAVGNVAQTLWGKGRNFLAGLWDGIKDKWEDVRSWFSDLPGKVTNAVGNLGSILFAAGSSVLDGFFRGLKSKWDEVTGWVKGIGQWIADNKGPEAYDKALLVPAGKNIMAGLQAGMKSEMPRLQGLLHGVGPMIRSNIGAPSMGGGVASGGNTYNITVNAGVGDPREIGRVAVEAIKKYERSNGKVFAAA